jgi:hypothetical protein
MAQSQWKLSELRSALRSLERADIVTKICYKNDLRPDSHP